MGGGARHEREGPATFSHAATRQAVVAVPVTMIVLTTAPPRLARPPAHPAWPQTKDERIRELRGAIASAMDGTSAAEGQSQALLRSKQQVVGVCVCMGDAVKCLWFDNQATPATPPAARRHAGLHACMHCH